MLPRVETPEDLRRDIVGAKNVIVTGRTMAADKDSAKARELADLKSRQAILVGEIPALKISALTDADAAGKLANKERQLQEIGARIETLSNATAEQGGLTLASAQPVFQQLLRFYWDALPLTIETHCALFYRNSSDIRNALPMFECVQVLRSLRDRGYSLPSMPATENNVRWLFGVFDRALRGQPHLAIDQTEYMEATKS